ncbi:MAG: arginine--tRNA ligase [Chloroflexi bacterium]|nr:arginine--tRNA ligase [Chloroflexota bacterium]
MVKRDMARLLEEAVRDAQRRGLIPLVALPDVLLERPQNPEHGDHASSLPLKLARAARMNPMAIAQAITSCIQLPPQVQKVTTAPPGFINFALHPAWLARQVDTILELGEGYGNLDLGGRKPIQVEFVSVNPTGPLHVGHGRGAILGSTLARVLAAAGYSVATEYYINDAGNQMNAFYRSLFARYQQALGLEAELPPDGYQGDYVIDMAREIVAREGDRFLNMPPPEAVEAIGKIGVKKVLESIAQDLARLGVTFDVWFSEQSLYREGQYQRAMAILRDKGYIEEREGAVWFVSTALGEDKDNVLVRGDGSPTYFASDVAYHYNKFQERGFQQVINIWGADHQGHVSRMKAVVGALGFDPDRLRIIITQMVTLKRGEALLRASKRSGDIVTLRELVDEVGADACRFVFLSRSADSQMEFDLELAKLQAPENPVYYVQYAHARIASILHLAQERGIDYSSGDVALLTHPAEQALLRKMIQLEELVETVALSLEPHYLPHYSQDLATAFHSFYKQCRVVSKNEKLTHARLKLVAAAQITLARTLHLMGMTAPERM